MWTIAQPNTSQEHPDKRRSNWAYGECSQSTTGSDVALHQPKKVLRKSSLGVDMLRLSWSFVAR